MSDKMKIREGKDGYSYPYTSPDLVVDETGKSNTTKFNEISSQFKDIANLFTTEQTDTEIILKYGNTIILTVPLSGLTPTEKAELLSSNLCFYEPTDVPNTWVTDSTGKVLNVDTEAFYDLFYDPYVGTNSDGYTVTKTELGKDQSNTYPLYEYDFKPKKYNRTILLSSGMHTYELSAHFGCGWLIKSIMEKHNDNLMLKYLYENVRIKIIPIVNPWGWNQNPKTYGNVNGVNPNRNFDYKDSNGDSVWSKFPVYSSNKSDSNYNEWNVKGSAPFSESEVKILRDWALKNKDVAEFWIDCHTGLGLGPWDNFLYYSSDSELKTNIEKALERLENRIKTKYHVTTATKEVRIDDAGSIRLNWAEKIAGIPGLTVEQTPNNTKWGTSLNNESGDIANYCTTLLTYIMEFLVTKYDDATNTYTITNTLTNCTNSNSSTSVTKGSSYTGTITADIGYKLSNVTVTMGGVDITSNVYANGSINIPSVSGDIIINANTTSNISSYCLAKVNLANGNVTDESGKGNNATLNGSYTTDSESVILDGTNCIIDTGLKLLQENNTEFTIKIKFKCTNIKSTTSYIFEIGENIETGLFGYMIYQTQALYPTNQLIYKYNNNAILDIGNAETSTETLPVINKDTQYEYILTYNGTILKLYINKVLSYTGTVDLNTMPNKNLILGNREDLTRGFVGNIYEYEIYNKALF